MAGMRDDERWISESRLLGLCRLPKSALHGWTQAGVIEPDPGGAYDRAAVAEVALLAALRPHYSGDDLGRVWKRAKTDGIGHEIVRQVLRLDKAPRLDLVLEPDFGHLSYVESDEQLVRAVRHPAAPRRVLILPLGEQLRLILSGFESFASDERRPTRRQVGRPPKRRANLRSIADAR